MQIDSKAVFEVDDARLGIGTFSRPLLDHEARSFRKAWEMEAVPGFSDFEVGSGRVSFVARPEFVAPAWEVIDRLLAAATRKIKKVS